MKKLNLFILSLLTLVLASCGGPRKADNIEMKKWVFCRWISSNYDERESIYNDFLYRLQEGIISVDGLEDDLFSELCLKYFEDNHRSILYDDWSVENLCAEISTLHEFYTSGEWKDAISGDGWGYRYHELIPPNVYSASPNVYKGHNYYYRDDVFPTHEELEQLDSMFLSGKLKTYQDIDAVVEQWFQKKTPNKNEAYKFRSSEKVKVSMPSDFCKISWNMLPLGDFLKYALLYQNPEKAKLIVGNLAHAFDSYLGELAEEQVSVINWNYDEDALGDTYTGYLVEYEIGEGDYYMLLQLTEYDKKDRYTWKVAYEGSSLIEMQQKYR